MDAICGEMKDRELDCVFLVGLKSGPKAKITTQKKHLAEASPVFEAMFFGNLPEVQTVIPVPDVTPQAFGLMLEWIAGTSDLAKNTVDELLKLWYVAEKYQIFKLTAKCLKLIQLKLSNSDSFWVVYEFANCYANQRLTDICHDVLTYYGPEPALSFSKIEDVSFSTLHSVLDMDTISISSEIDVFNGVEHWAKVKCKQEGLEVNTANLRKVAPGVVEKIRFLTMTAKEFVNGPCWSPLLTQSDAFAILVNLADADQVQQPLPQGFSAIRKSRLSAAQAPLIPKRFHQKLLFFHNFFVEMPRTVVKVARRERFVVSLTFSDEVAFLGFKLPARQWDGKMLNTEYTVKIFDSEMKLLAAVKAVERQDFKLMPFLFVKFYGGIFMEMGRKYLAEVMVEQSGNYGVLAVAEPACTKKGIQNDGKGFVKVSLSDYNSLIIIDEITAHTAF